MLKNEKRYEFRKRLLKVHNKKIRETDVLPSENELLLKSGVSIIIPENYTDVIFTAARDFSDYLFETMGISSMLTSESKDENYILTYIDANQKEDYIITVDEEIKICAKNDRGIAQAFYALEDMMNLKKAPILKKETIKHTYLFSPRMVHSGYGFDQYPSEHLKSIAHAGMDAILVFVKGVNMTPAGFMDFNELIHRAARYGIDVYAYSYLVSEKHPEEKDAQEFYNNLYGTLFRECPDLKGVVLVGESVGFPSKDPHVSLNGSVDKDGFPTGKPAPGWWPCYDYPQWLECVKKAVRNEKADADIVFWTYNWGYVDKEHRIKLINTLPTDITLMATFEMFEKYKIDGVTEFTADYSLTLPGPGEYFTTEAEAAKKRGIRMYAMANTAGTTWDMGVVPYEPMPYQWIKRYKGLRDANEKYGLSGLMESHHFGFWPSFISDLAKQCYIKENTDFDEAVKKVVTVHYGKENADKICEALNLWSEAITHYIPSDADQWGAFRIGPSYPLCLIKEMKPRREAHAINGTGIVFTMYPADYHPRNALPTGRGMLPYMRVDTEIASLEKMYSLMRSGSDILSAITKKSEELEYLVNMGEYICCYVRTGINAKKWYKLSAKIKSEDNADEILKIADKMEQILDNEKINATAALEFVRKDSRLGWEPSMEYVGDAENIEWKLKHLEYVKDFELQCFRKNTV